MKSRRESWRRTSGARSTVSMASWETDVSNHMFHYPSLTRTVAQISVVEIIVCVVCRLQVTFQLPFLELGYRCKYADATYFEALFF